MRIAIGKHKSGTAYLRATDSEDGGHIRAAAQKLGIKVTKRRAGANHHGRVGAYDHYHVENPEHAVAIHDELKKQDGQQQDAPGGTTPTRSEPTVTNLPGGMKHTAGTNSKGEPTHSVSSDGAILGHGKTKEEAMAMADKATRQTKEPATPTSPAGGYPAAHAKAEEASEIAGGYSKETAGRMKNGEIGGHEKSGHPTRGTKEGPEPAIKAHATSGALHDHAAKMHDKAVILHRCFRQET